MIDFSKIQLDYAVKSDRLGQRYPALQASNYQPKSLSEQIEPCLSDTSFELLSSQAQSALKTEVISCKYKREPVLMYQIVSPLRWIFLAVPKIFWFDKKTKQISYPERGVKLAGTDKVTIAKCFLACLVDDNLLEDADGLPQIFTLKLTSNKTQVIGYSNNNSSTTTVFSLNQHLQKNFKNQQNDFIHLISVKLAIKPTEFVSSRSGESSVGILFTIEEKPLVLTPPHQRQIFELISHQELQSLFVNPFELKQQDNFFEQSTQEPGLAYQEPDF